MSQQLIAGPPGRGHGRLGMHGASTHREALREAALVRGVEAGRKVVRVERDVGDVVGLDVAVVAAHDRAVAAPVADEGVGDGVAGPAARFRACQGEPVNSKSRHACMQGAAHCGCFSRRAVQRASRTANEKRQEQAHGLLFSMPICVKRLAIRLHLREGTVMKLLKGAVAYELGYEFSTSCSSMQQARLPSPALSPADAYDDAQQVCGAAVQQEQATLNQM